MATDDQRWGEGVHRSVRHGKGSPRDLDALCRPNLPRRFRQVLDDVGEEYIRARLKHGEHTLDGLDIGDQERLAILGEEFGEVCRALTYDHTEANLREELVQVANVALTWASTLKRRAR